MNGTKAVLDSNTIIYASKQTIDVEKLLVAYDEFYVSVITYMEVYAYEFENADEKTLIDELFASLEIFEINRHIADQAIVYRKNKIKKIKLPDAIILAATKYLNADLLTEDYDDFQTVDPSIQVLSLANFK